LFTNEALALHERHARQAANPEAAV
jgi:hypothetical protein